MSVFTGYEVAVAVLKTTDEDWASAMLTPERLYHACVADTASTSTAHGCGYRPALGLSRTTTF
jgi:hypothetical protein